jgi:hypothetical protein
MDSIFEHVVNEVRIWLDKIVQSRQNLEIFSFLLVEEIESHLILLKLHFVNSGFELSLLILDHLFSFFDLFLFFLQLLYFFVNLFLHHLE